MQQGGGSILTRGFQPLTNDAMNAHRTRCAAETADRRYELFKTTKKYDDDGGRKTHDFPSVAELPA